MPHRIKRDFDSGVLISRKIDDAKRKKNDEADADVKKQTLFWTGNLKVDIQLKSLDALVQDLHKEVINQLMLKDIEVARAKKGMRRKGRKGEGIHFHEGYELRMAKDCEPE